MKQQHDVAARIAQKQRLQWWGRRVESNCQAITRQGFAPDTVYTITLTTREIEHLRDLLRIALPIVDASVNHVLKAAEPPRLDDTSYRVQFKLEGRSVRRDDGRQDNPREGHQTNK